ncbi:tRNA (adenosine(37)-N6)-threonylcarbamoyltransferase complex ATPase subunit type 1 TsaE [uncultured Psychroserpens sp.]|uniref:tRNA (adenosine(37)-N6)-threonylcarbamoyltransferase complex ATPase subunit type 1 TsaE n=1 Tax=uncultured Psychroserpens sp. TaxID=255436 RepID=UPI0026023CFE|nr:tRNA (adenosine(37)-N6)-threonylcarbamoyltransferase complex ATPase subunit type 1 TsaE [uncultured Psychroserpens sp.]
MEISYHIDELDKIAKVILKQLNSKIVLLHGNMGVGKTTLIKSMVKALGSIDDVSSPTFSLVNEYKSDYFTIYHFDLYRINDEVEILNFGFEDYLLNTDNNWMFIEWPELAKNLLPKEVSSITIEQHNQTSRTLKLSQNELLTQKNAMEHYKNA